MRSLNLKNLGKQYAQTITALTRAGILTPLEEIGGAWR